MDYRTLFTTVFALFIGAGFLSAQKSFNALMYEGNKLFDQNKYEAAASRYIEAAKQKDKDYAAHYNLGNALYKSKKYEEARAEYEKANQLSHTLKDKAAALHNLGNSYMQLNQPDKAAEFYKQSLKQEPRNEATRKNYEIAKLKEKENQQSQKDKGGGGGGNGQKQKEQQGSGDQKKEGPGGSGSGPESDGEEGNGNNPNPNGRNNDGALPKGTQDAILNRVSDKERETAKRILNKDSYSMPESNEKDW
jgi:tetratricopeptide (TPR) repeat protein